MKKNIGDFKVDFIQVLKEDGVIDKKLMPSLTNNQIKQMYESMILSKVFDEKALKLQRQGRLGTYASLRGQEASEIGSAFAIQDNDFVFPSFRENGVYLVRGMPPELLYLYWSGDERGLQIPKNVNMAPVSITVGAHPLHAVGFAKAKQYLKQKGAVITYFGDGATSEGDFHEAMNFAGVFKAPIVFICQNNQYAISVPVKEQTSSQTIAQKAIAYGFNGVQVDGNDVFAVYKVASEALANARAGKGPTLIESFTYRVNDHTTADDSKKYRNENEIKLWLKKDPILRLEIYMKKNKLLNDKYKADVLKKSEEIVEKAVEKFEAIPAQNPQDLFNYIYDKPTKELEEQRDSLKNEN